MTTYKKNGESASNGKLLSLPPNAGREIVEASAVIARPLMGTDKFIQFCRECSLAVNREPPFKA